MQVKIVIGTVAFMLTMVVFGYAALREPTRLEHFTAAATARQVENGAYLYVNNCSNCHGEEGKAEECYDTATGEPIACQGIPLNYAQLVCGDRPERLDIMAWDGSKSDYIYRTIAAGRGEVMPTWSEFYGGPLRNDQVLDLTAFVLNFEGEELCSGPPPVAYEFPETYEEFAPQFAEGDPARGADLYDITYGCQACHGELTDSSWEGTGPWMGAIEENAQARIPEYTVEQYVYESILHPNDYVVSGYAANLMPTNFAQRMGQTEETPQDLMDIMAYIIDGQ